jgi:conjugative relaxase-like TrwC/TraI family protein
MVSKAVCTSAEGAINYFEQHLNVADYFVEGEKVDRGQFIGKVAERLGLDEAAITREKFVAFAQCDMEGLGAESSRQRASEIKYIEFTYSPPKAVSVVAAVDERVKAELYAAVKEELCWFEEQVAVRDRRGNLANEEVTKPTGQMIAALFQHETSRTNDPDFHVHALIGNVTWDAERKGYFAIHYGQMLELRKTLDARIHNNLAARMGDLGYHVEAAPAGFGLKEVPAATVDMFSERGHQVKTVKALLQRGYTAAQITGVQKGLPEDQKRQLLANPDLLKEKLGRPEGKPLLIADHRIDQQAVTLTRPKKVRITNKTLREDVPSG